MISNPQQSIKGVNKIYKVIRDTNQIIQNQSNHQNYSLNSPQLMCIQQSQTNLQYNNIFKSANPLRLSEGYVFPAKQYEILGHKIMKNYNPKKQKKKAIHKRADSATSRLSKNSSIRNSVLQKDMMSKDGLLEEVERLEQLIKTKQLAQNRRKGNLYTESKQLLNKYEKQWEIHNKILKQKLKKKQNRSLINVSQNYRTKIQQLQRNTLHFNSNYIRPSQWYQSLRDEDRIKTIPSKNYVENIIKKIKPNQFLSVSGINKFRKEVKWINESTAKKYFIRG